MPITYKKIFTVRTDIIPNVVLSPFSIENYEQAEAEFARKHLAIVGAAAESASDRIAEMMLRIAHNEVAINRFGMGGTVFRVCAMTDSNLPYILWLAMLAKQPKTTIGQVRAMVEAMDEDTQAKVQKGVLECIGYSFTEEKKTEKTTPPPNQSPSTSPPSSPDSASADSTTTKSAA